MLHLYLIYRDCQGHGHLGHHREHYSNDLYKPTGGTVSAALCREATNTWEMVIAQGSVLQAVHVADSANTFKAEWGNQNMSGPWGRSISSQLSNNGIFQEWTFLQPTPNCQYKSPVIVSFLWEMFFRSDGPTAFLMHSHPSHLFTGHCPRSRRRRHGVFLVAPFWPRQIWILAPLPLSKGHYINLPLAADLLRRGPMEHHERRKIRLTV